MAKNIETYSISEDMRADILACYREVAPNCIYQKTAYEEAINHPAKEFYLTAKQAYQRISQYLNGNVWMIEGMRNKIKKQAYYDIMDVIMKLSQMPEHQGKSLRKLCSIAVKMPAPRFYISAGSLSNLFNNTINNRYDDDGRCIKKVQENIARKDFMHDYYLSHKNKYPR